MNLRTADFFCGIGGIRLGFEQACEAVGFGHSCVFSCDINPDSCKTYEARFGPPSPMCDITVVDPDSVPDFDVALAGFPCQAFSIAGEKAGFEDTRGTLFFNLAKILEAKKPKAFLFENVKGLVHHDDGRTIARIVEICRSLGYVTHVGELNSKDFGVPQNRPRVYIVGFLGFGGFSFPTPTDSSKRLKDILEPSVDRKYFVSKTYWTWMKAYRKKSLEAGNQFGYVIRDREGLSGTILCGGMGRERNLIVDPNPPPPDTEMNEDGVRQMTPLEWERLQGFPPGWTDGSSCTSRMDMLGNSVTVPVIRAVAERMLPEIANPVPMTVSIFD